jgi:hypothetical protein
MGVTSCRSLIADEGRELTKRDLEDLRADKPVLAKAEYKKRVQAVLRTARAQEVAGNCVKRFRKTCQEVWDLDGAAASMKKSGL